MTYLPQQPIGTLQEAFAFFDRPKNCLDYIIELRWPDGKVACPTCGSEGVTWIPSRSLFQCKSRHPKRQFSVKVGTIFEDSPIPLGKWLLIAWMLGSCRNGMSSYEVARTIGITQKSAWFMLHRLRLAMRFKSIILSGIVEADESYYGGRIKNKHAKARKQGNYKDKTPIFGMVERGGMVVASVVPEAKEKTVVPLLQASVSKEAVLHTDSYPIYDKLKAAGFNHEAINHQQDFFVRGTVHTNTIENFWACLKRMLTGTYVAVKPHHLDAYVAEQVFRFNHRFKFISEERRLGTVLEGSIGRRLTYRELVGRAA